MGAVVPYDRPPRTPGVKRLAVIGGGPIGIAAALGALDRGFDVTVFESGQVGQSLRSWGSTRFFTPLGMNIPPRMRKILGDMPANDELLTGPEFIDRVLRPVASSEPLRGRIRTLTRVVAVGRRGLTRGDYAADPLRSERPFRLLVESRAESGSGAPRGSETLEEVVEADFVLDASGGHVVPNPIGCGVPALGEATLASPPIRTLGELEAACAHLSGKRVLLVGDGHSAANAVAILAAIEGVDVTWAVRTPNRRPCREIFGDPLSERERVVATANALAEDPPPFLTVERRTTVERFENRDGQIHVHLSGGRTIVCDAVAAFTGFHPDEAIRLELPVEISPVTQGGARLHRALSGLSDRLAVSRMSPQDLESGEPGFYFIGSRAYGRTGSFLLQSGLAQLDTILSSLQ